MLLAACLVGTVISVPAAVAAAHHRDQPGDNNAAPDITSVTVAESADGVVAVTVAVANYRALPFESWINVWFDLDNNPRTGDGGDEVLVQFNDDGGIRYQRWVRSELVRRPATGMTGAFSAGALTLNVPKTALDGAARFGVLAVGSRGQDDGEGDQRVSADYAPNRGRAQYSAPDPLTIGDASGDHQAAPDLTDVVVSDDASGRVRFAVSTPSHARLTTGTWVELDVDVDRHRSTGDDGVDAYVTIEGSQVTAARWSAEEEEYRRVRASGVTARSTGGVVTFVVPRRFLDNVATFGFYLVSGHFSGDDNVATDVAPNGDAWWRYTLTHKPPLSLAAGTPRGIPRRAVAGKRFATCSFGVPGDAAGATIRGSMTVHSTGEAVKAPFTFPVNG